jgi:hypothetical protein
MKMGTKSYNAMFYDDENNTQEISKRKDMYMYMKRRKSKIIPRDYCGLKERGENSGQGGAGLLLY